METRDNRSEVEFIKEKSNYLRGTLIESLADEITGALRPDDVTLIKFHGSYQQFDRELESERKKQKLEQLYSFMTRVRLVGGIATPAQWLAIDNLATKYGNDTIKLTTRQAFQLHGILKRNLKATIKEINQALMDTIAACGDVNRNVMVNPNPYLSAVHAEVFEIAKRISDHLTPRTGAYHEIWLDKKLVAGGEQEEEPIYGKTYLPRKFKMALAIPPYNDVDIFTNCFGLIAIEEEGKLVGFNITAGGGMGTTFGNQATFPRLADVVAFCTPQQALDVAEKTVLIQKDLGNRVDRKLSRFKYTVEKLGVAAFKLELEKRLGYKLEDPKPYKFLQNGDTFGWTRGIDNMWHLTMFIEGGRVKDAPAYKLKSALREIALVHKGDFRLTGNQNLIIASVHHDDKMVIDEILKKFKIDPFISYSGLRLNSLACVALNTCSLAFAEAERYLPLLIDKLDKLLIAQGLEKDSIVIRMTGCPNGCARPFVAEIGLVGKAPGRYNLYLGGDFQGQRLNKLFKENINEDEILATLKPLFEDYSLNRFHEEHFGDFTIRQKYI